MKITKYGHCCLLVEKDGVRLLTDPGMFSSLQNEVKDIGVVLITHEHADHFHIDSVKAILKNSPDTLIVTNSAVNELLKKENILNVRVVEDGEEFEYEGISLRGVGTIHEVIHAELPRVQNTGYLIAGKLFIPGDSFEHKDIHPELLALPVAGPWMNIATALDYCIRLNPKKCFPIHDAILSEYGLGVIKRVVPMVLKNHNIDFVDLPLNTETEF